MVIYAPHFLYQMGGSVGTNNEEIWSCGIRMFSETYGGFDEVGWFEGVGRSAAQEWFLRPTSFIASHCKLRWVKFNFIDASGHYEDPNNTREYFYTTVVAGAGGSSNNPWQASVVLGWRTDSKTRGRASKGRIYSPAPSVSVTGTTGLFLPSSAASMAASAAQLLNTLDAGFDVTSTIRPHIMSGVDGSYSEINSVVVDNRIDIQRRRANAVVAVESVAPVTY